MNEYASFIQIIKDYIQLFEALISVEQTKLDAAVENKITFVEECMNKEQAAILRLRGLEQKREEAQRQLGLEGLTFRQILEQAPEDTVPDLKTLFDNLSNMVRTFQSVSGSAKDMIELNLHTIQSSLSSAETAPKDSPSDTQNKKDKKTHFTSRMV